MENLNLSFVEVFEEISKWAAEYEQNNDLTVIDEKHFMAICMKVREINEEFLWTEHGELSDAVENWLNHLVSLRTEQIKIKGVEKGKKKWTKDKY